MRMRYSARGGGRADSGSHWISYSDMMASLLLVFVLAVCYSVYQYYNMLEIKTQQLNEQQAELERQQVVLAQKEEEVDALNVTLMGKEQELSQIQIQLDIREEELNAARTALLSREEEMNALQLQLNEQRDKLAAMESILNSKEAELAAQQDRIEALIGVKYEIIQSLSSALSRAGLSASVDSAGAIVLEGSILFDSAQSSITEAGQTFLNRFIPVYLDVLLSDEYKDFVAEIVIEGHADSTGTYERNIGYATDRAEAVAKYCLSVPGLTSRQRALLEELMTVSSRSSADPIIINGVEDKTASRRVVFKFSMRDAEMIEERNRLLRENGGT